MNKFGHYLQKNAHYSLLITITIAFILQDPDWGDNTTAVTGLSDLAFPPDAMTKWGAERDSDSSEYIEGWKFAFKRYLGTWVIAIVAAVAFISPVLMVAIPQMGFVDFRDGQLRCDVRKQVCH